MLKRGLSDVVTTVLIILIAMAGVVIIWNVLQPFLQHAGDINTQKYTTRLSVPENSIVLDPDQQLLSLNVGKEAGQGDIAGFIFGLTDPAGNVKTFRQNFTLGQFEVKNFQINYSDFVTDDIVSVTVTPIFRSNSTGKETLGDPIQQPVKNKTTYKLPSGLVAHWKFDGNWVEGISGLNGGVVGSTTFDYNNKKIGSAAANFSGSSGTYIQVSDNSLLNPTQFTIVAWVNPRNLTLNAFNNIVDKSSLSTGYAFGFDRLTSTWQLKTRTSGNSNTVSIAGTNSLNNWEFLAATYTSSLSTIYYNSNNVQVQNAITLSPSTTTFKIGSSFNSTIDEVMFFNRALTSQEINDIRTKYK